MDAERRDPGRVADDHLGMTVAPQQGLEPRDDLGGVVRPHRAGGVHQPPEARFGHGERDHGAVGRQDDVDLVLGHAPIDAGVGQEEPFLVLGPLEREAQDVPDRAPRAVASDQPARPDDLLRPALIRDGRRHPVVVLREPGEPPPAIDLQPLARQMLREDPLGLALRQDQDERVRGFEAVEVEADVGDPAVVRVGVQAVHLPASVEHRADDAHVFEDFERPRLHSQGPGLVGRLPVRVDDPAGDAVPEQSRGHREPHGPRADDQGIDRFRRRCGHDGNPEGHESCRGRLGDVISSPDFKIKPAIPALEVPG